MEWKSGTSGIDSLSSDNGDKYLPEVEGCALMRNEAALFPDA
ncbi:MAG: DNA/RNA nuclease SfsA [Promethearchaeota archaeon]